MKTESPNLTTFDHPAGFHLIHCVFLLVVVFMIQSMTRRNKNPSTAFHKVQNHFSIPLCQEPPKQTSASLTPAATEGCCGATPTKAQGCGSDGHSDNLRPPEQQKRRVSSELHTCADTSRLFIHAGKRFLL